MQHFILHNRIEDYLRAVAGNIITDDRSSIPILAGSPDEVRGIGDIPLLPSSSDDNWPLRRPPGSLIADFHGGNAPIKPGAALCLTHPDDLPSAAAAVICRGLSKKSLPMPRDPSRLAEALTLALRHHPRSLTLVAPPLLAAGIKWTAEAIAALRAVAGTTGALPWGILATPEPSGVTMMAAKAVMQARIVNAYAGGRRCFVDDDGLPRGARRRAPRWPRASTATDIDAFEFISTSWLSHGRSAALLKRMYDTLIINGHGRGYCGAGGLLCAATFRHPRNGSTYKCVENLSCAADEFLRVDPRRFDVRVLVASTCDAANLNGRHWLTGDPGVAFLAAQGSPSAVITTDGVLVENDSAILEFLVSHAETHTVGEWARLLSDLVAGPNLPASFYVLGDPDIPLGTGPREFIVRSRATAIQGDSEPSLWKVRVPKGSLPVVKVDLHRSPASGEILYVWSDEEPLVPLRATARADNGTLTCWLERPCEPQGLKQIFVSLREPVAVLPDTLRAAQLALASAPTLLMPQLHESWTGTLHAAQRITDIGAEALGRTGKIRLENTNLLQAQIVEAEARWAIAQAACISRLSSLHPASIWPYDLWKVDIEAAQLDEAPCPVCGNRTLVRRSYRTGSLGIRYSYDCVRCCRLVDDRPAADAPLVMTLEAPETVSLGQPVEVGLQLVNNSDVRRIFCAAYVSMRPLNHGLASSCDVLTCDAAPCSKRTITTSFNPTGREPRAHIYAIRAVLLADMIWYWGCRPITIA